MINGVTLPRDPLWTSLVHPCFWLAFNRPRRPDKEGWGQGGIGGSTPLDGPPGGGGAVFRLSDLRTLILLVSAGKTKRTRYAWSRWVTAIKKGPCGVCAQHMHSCMVRPWHDPEARLSCAKPSLPC